MRNYPRTYVVKYDTGREFCNTEFTSNHKANSKANHDDARRALVRKYGNHARNYRILEIYRAEN